MGEFSQRSYLCNHTQINGQNTTVICTEVPWCCPQLQNSSRVQRGTQQRVGCFPPLPFAGILVPSALVFLSSPESSTGFRLLKGHLFLSLLLWAQNGYFFFLREKAASDVSQPILAASSSSRGLGPQQASHAVVQVLYVLFGLYFIWLLCSFGQESWSSASYYYFLFFLRL